MERNRDAPERMDDVQRCYVAKRPGYDREGERALTVLRDQLRCTTVTNVRSVVRYDVEGADAATFERVKRTIFAEAPVDDLLDEEMFEASRAGITTVGIETLPGQFDQHADAAEQTMAIAGGKRPTVRVADLFLLEGTIAPEELHRLKKYLINPVDCREASQALPATLQETLPEPPDVRTIEGFIKLTEDALREVHARLKPAMTLADLRCVQEAFQRKGRDPTVTELRVLDTYWSDHCRHTTFTTEITEIALGGRTIVKNGEWAAIQDIEGAPFERMIARELQRFLADRQTLAARKNACSQNHDGGTSPLSLMELALFSMREAKAQGRLPDLEESEEYNAASIVVPVHFEDGRTEEWLLMFKNETHNHPTEIEAVGGDETCLGGVIRDPLSGRTFVFFGIRVSGSGDPREPIEQTLPGKHPQRKITTDAAKGFSGYGNKIGLATHIVKEFYHADFRAKRFAGGFVGGAAKREHVVRERPRPGDLILLVGGRTGRDGIGGASGSSKPHDAESTATCGAEVQKGNPVEERKLQRLLPSAKVSTMIRRCNDFGAGGIAVAVGELADGVDVDLDPVPLKYLGLDGTEIAISEAQERMAVVIAPENKESFMRLAEEENLEATVIATVTAEERMRMHWRGKTVCDLDHTLLKGGWAKRTANADIQPVIGIATFFQELPEELIAGTLRERWLRNLSRLNVCSKRGLQERFDSTVGALTVMNPFGGTHQLSPSEAAIALFPAEGACTVAVAAPGYDPDLAKESPFHGALYAVIDSVARIVAAGGSREAVRLTLQNYFEKLDQDPMRWGKPLAAQLGARMAQRELGTPAIGGKDSMSGSHVDRTTGEHILDVPPTIVSFAVTTMERESAIPSHFQKPGSTIVYLFAQLDDTCIDACIPQWKTLRSMWTAAQHAARGNMTLSSHAIHTGGPAAALTEMSLGNGIGVRLRSRVLPDAQWFAPRYGSLIVELPAGTNPHAVFSSVPHIVLGRTTDAPGIAFENVAEETISGDELIAAYEKPLEEIFPTLPRDLGDGSLQEHPDFPARLARLTAPIAHPRAAILTFPGTNCERETALAFERAGARTTTPVFVNLTQRCIRESIARFASAIHQAQILCFPGGFSAGDEPDGSGKFIAAVLRNAEIQDAVQRFLDRGGLILGICNGFQGLIKSCLLPSGTVGTMREQDPTLTHNTLGRYISRIARHRVTSVLSPWMSQCDVGELLDLPIAHGEGRLIQLPPGAWERGQIPLQYVGLDSRPRMLFPDNPNGSADCAAALTDPTGRIFGLMAHPERATPGRSANIPGERKGMQIFEGGVGFFTD